MTIPKEVAVLGGGPGGLATALALSRQGFEVTVYEQSPEILEVGAGLQISPNGVAVLRALGLQEALDEAGVRAHAVRLMDGPSGKDVARIDVASGFSGRGYYFFHRVDLVKMLSDAAWVAGARIELGQRVLSVAPGPDGVALEFEDQTTRTVPVLIAADGIHSVARKGLGDLAEPVFTGQTAWRTLVRNEGDIPPEVQVHMAPGQHLVRYPLLGGKLINIVAVQEKTDWIADGWHHEDNAARLRAAFSGFSLPVRDLLGRVDKVNLWGLHTYPVLPRWSSGAMAMLGDAAHPTLPFMAQGANMALEDAFVLARHMAGADTLESAFLAYEADRKARCTRIVAAAQANARNYHLGGLRRRVAHMALRAAGRFNPQVLSRRYAWLYGMDVTA